MSWPRPIKAPTWSALAELATVGHVWNTTQLHAASPAHLFAYTCGQVNFYRLAASPVPVSQLRARVDHYRQLCEAQVSGSPQPHPCGVPLSHCPSCQRVVGTVILAPEGMNGSLAGVRDSVHHVLHELSEDRELWSDAFDGETLMTNEEWGLGHTVPFARMKIKVKPEIIALKLDGEPLDLSNRGRHVDPSEWDDLIAQPDVLVLDTRNDFESKLGSFRDAIKPDKGKFSDFPQWVADNLPRGDGVVEGAAEGAPHPEVTRQRVAMFCTGGVRCEKASAYLIQRAGYGVRLCTQPRFRVVID